MIWYIRCPTCGKIIAENLDKYYADHDHIMNDPNLLQSEKDILASKLLDKYGYKRYCCRTRMLGIIPVPYHKIIRT